MERLTHQRNSGIKTGYWSPNKKDELVTALAAYEDTGLTPEDIMELKEFYSNPLNTAVPSIKCIMNEDGVLDIYDDAYDIVLHCASEEEQIKTFEMLHKRLWTPVQEQLPETDDYVLLSFANFSLLMIGRYERDEDGGGAWYVGDCDEEDTCISQNLFVNAWMPLPKPYREEDNAE